MISGNVRCTISLEAKSPDFPSSVADCFVRKLPQGSTSNSNWNKLSQSEKHKRRPLPRGVGLILLVAVFCLSAGAKNSKYLPSTNPARYISKVSKMNQCHRIAVVDQSVLDAASPDDNSLPPAAPRLSPQLETLLDNLAVVLSSHRLRSPPLT